MAFLGKSIFSISFVLSFFLGFGFEVVDVVPVFAVPVFAVLAGVGVFILFCKVVPIPRASPVGLVALPVWTVHSRFQVVLLPGLSWLSLGGFLLRDFCDGTFRCWFLLDYWFLGRS